MAPKRKRPPPSPTPAEPNPADATTHSATAPTAADTTATSSGADTLDDTAAPAFLNASFTTHRASPLYLGPSRQTLSQANIHTLSHRLRDLLVGDVIRGVELGLTTSTTPSGEDSSVMRRAGALEVVSLDWVRLEYLLGRYVGGEGEDDTHNDADTSLESAASAMAGGPPGKRRALQISLQYENGEYAALLLPPARGGQQPSPQDDDDEFAHLPLLLLRMPAPLKSVVCGFISRTFDCRITPLGLGTRSLVGALECWLGETKGGEQARGGRMAKDVMVTLGFYTPGVLAEQQQQPRKGVDANDEAAADGGSKASETILGVKTIDITVPLPDLRRFIKAGKAHDAATRPEDDADGYSPLARRRLGGNKDEESWTWRGSNNNNNNARPQPFTEALAAYMRHHLALDMFHPAVRVTRVACGGFVLSEGRVKLFGVPPPTTEEDGESGRLVRDALSDGLQRGLWAVLGGLVERAQVASLVGPVGEDGVAL